MKNLVKSEKDILKKATNAVAQEFGIEQGVLKLSFKQRNGIFLTYQFTAKEKKAYMESDKTSYSVTMNVSGMPIDLYRN